MMKLRTLLIGFCCLIICAAAVSAQQTPASPNRWEADIKKFEEADRQNPPAKSAVVFVGSSSIRMWKDLAEDFPDTKVINRGFGGSQLADSTYYADRIVIPYQPRMVVLYAGDNDLAAGKTPQQVFEDYTSGAKWLRLTYIDTRAYKQRNTQNEMLPVGCDSLF